MGLPLGFDAASAYRAMVRMRLVEEALAQAWADGLVPGEYHSGIGEEGINAGVLSHLSGRDSMALDHRNTSPLVGRGTDIKLLMLEVMGSEDGLNRGWAGHMHLMDPGIPAAADGIVGASGPLAPTIPSAAAGMPGSIRCMCPAQPRLSPSSEPITSSMSNLMSVPRPTRGEVLR